MSEKAELSDWDEEDDATKVPVPGTCIAVVCPDSAVEASYFAAGLARRLVERPRPEADNANGLGVVLVDGLPGAGGIDVVVDLDHAPGARWTALRGADGALDTERLLRALPKRDGVAVLSHDRALDAVDESVRDRVLKALDDCSGWVVGTVPPERVLARPFSCVVLLARGSVTGTAAAQRYVEQMTGELPVAVVLLETPHSARMLIADTLGSPLLAAAPTRWKLPHAAGVEVSQGQWPGAKDRVLGRLLDDVAVYLRSQGRSALWA